MKRFRSVSLCFLCLAVCVLGSNAEGEQFDEPENYDYSYGDYRYQYEGEPPAAPQLHAESHVADPTHLVDEPRGEELPLCCPPNTVYDVYHNCTGVPEGWTWKPFLSGEPHALFTYKGFPKCKLSEPVSIYQKEVFFNDGDAFVPNYIQLDHIPRSKYCVTKVYDSTSPEDCEIHQTKVFVCLEKKQPEPGLYWTGVAVAHLLLFLTLLAFFFIRDLRSLQGQYMICFIISLLLYNICLLPGSVLTLDISFVSCVSLGAVKYFFFCGVMLWFNVICFDIWRTLKNRQDVGSRKRFLLYSVYTWVVGAVLTTVVLVTPYATGKDRDSSLMELVPDVCKLKTDINIILQLVETLLMIVNFIFIILATANTCKYPKFGNGLPRCEATLSLKQGWKLFIIMIGHTLIDVPDDIMEIRVVDLWRYVLVESLAIFAVFAYRKTVLKAVYRCFCRAPCYHPDEERSSVQEKDQLTTMH
ncbi:hypothetical protein OTU49_013009 [Cherax quadricarinatus]|uniref:G-protein coupled receptors family 2 profile 2 domain-containing protein n=2 Tax=Cherax quadricarinatus TaxID=27406 RepID=A0AAW0VVF8_CHEQU|nr:uncharacterized protein LOC128686957 isoform X1 [Cherax quadricarinatus]XP_053630239.1 uncharacterized protein LOC128686957 isoform X1 [Cherax quadricarinatus]XP_053630240.1 uncharacterized protein LOC128686957 isoform X1 [Cherax quadricarinatus]